MIDILFICKFNERYAKSTGMKDGSALFNKTHLISNLIYSKSGLKTQVIQAVDMNAAYQYIKVLKPKHVILEAIWGVPSEIHEIRMRHPYIKFYCHVRSNVPFLAVEGNAIDRILDYTRIGMTIIVNHEYALHALRSVLKRDQVQLLNNIYIKDPHEFSYKDNKVVNIGCFGAIRSMKNHLNQAMAAIQFAKEINKKLRFHINFSRVQAGGHSVLNNLIALFEKSGQGELVLEEWIDPNKFVDHIKSMDIGMQVSLSETFNNVTADFITAGVPIVVSDNIEWVHSECIANDHCTMDIVKTMHKVRNREDIVKVNQELLRRYSEKALREWIEYFQ